MKSACNLYTISGSAKFLYLFKMCIFVYMNLRNVIFISFYATLMVVLTACGQKESATTQNLSKENSMEVVVTTKHLNEKYDVIKTTRRIYLQNKLIKESSSFDTIPALGKAKLYNEDTQKFEFVQKDYDIFVTVQ